VFASPDRRFVIPYPLNKGEYHGAENVQDSGPGGDGTGPEVIKEGIKVVEAAAKKENFKIAWTPYDLGGERYKKTGEILPESALKELRTFDAIYLGAIGHPDVKPGILEKASAPAPFRARPVHKPEAGKALP